MNKFNPVFSLYAYTTEPLSVAVTNKQLLEFSVYDKDTQSFNVDNFNVVANDSLFEVVPDTARNVFLLRLKDKK